MIPAASIAYLLLLKLLSFFSDMRFILTCFSNNINIFVKISDHKNLTINKNFYSLSWNLLFKQNDETWLYYIFFLFKNRQGLNNLHGVNAVFFSGKEFNILGPNNQSLLVLPVEVKFLFTTRFSFPRRV